MVKYLVDWNKILNFALSNDKNDDSKGNKKI